MNGDFNQESDIDVLIDFEKTTTWSLFDYVDMQEELEAIFKRSVDILNKAIIKKSANPYRKKSILESAQTIYEKAA